MTRPATARENLAEAPNPLGLEGLEFIEYETAKPQALGQVLETMGFRPVARHRSREVLLYRQGGMNIVVNGHRATAHDASAHLTSADRTATIRASADTPVLSAFALRVRDAGAAYQRAIDRGAWPVPADVKPMELHIPAIHGVGASRIYFVDRWREFSIWDVDFVPIPTVEQHPAAIAGLHWFGLVQYIGFARIDDWTAFYAELFGWRALPDGQRFGVMPSGRLLQSPDGLVLQLVEAPIDAADAEPDETLQRIGFGVPDVMQAVRELRGSGVDFVDSDRVRPDSLGAVTQTQLGSVMFELVKRVP